MLSMKNEDTKKNRKINNSFSSKAYKAYSNAAKQL